MAVFHILLKFQQPFLLPIFFYSPILPPGPPRLPSLLLLPSFLLLESCSFSPSCSFCVWIHISLCLALFSTQNSFLLFFFPGSSCTGAVDGMNLGCTGNGTQGLMHSKYKLYYQTPFPASIRWLWVNPCSGSQKTWTSLKCSVHC